MAFYQDLPFDYIHIEPSTKCNAACPMCPRNQHGGSVIPSLSFVDFDLSLLNNIDVPASNLTLCGNYGDPILHPDLHNLVEYGLDTFPGRTTIMTNGGARSTKWWKELAELGDRVKVVFGIDGLADTNHLYRRHVRWDKLMANIEAFIGAGGYAVWKFIIFEHNKHQIEDAKKLAMEMNFKKFDHIWTNRFEGSYFPVQDKKGNHIYNLEEAEYTPKGFGAKNPYRSGVENPSASNIIRCSAQYEPSIYISADGRVYPCCDTGHHYNAHTQDIQDIQKQSSVYDLNNYKLSQIIQGPFFSEIQSKWSTSPAPTCLHTCGIQRDVLRKVESLGKTDSTK